MPHYIIEVTEVTKTNIHIEADNLEEAEDKAIQDQTEGRNPWGEVGYTTKLIGTDDIHLTKS